jgi:hypothetical protein
VKVEGCFSNNFYHVQSFIQGFDIALEKVIENAGIYMRKHFSKISSDYVLCRRHWNQSTLSTIAGINLLMMKGDARWLGLKGNEHKTKYMLVTPTEIFRQHIGKKKIILKGTTLKYWNNFFT